MSSSCPGLDPGSVGKEKPGESSASSIVEKHNLRLSLTQSLFLAHASLRSWVRIRRTFEVSRSAKPGTRSFNRTKSPGLNKSKFRIYPKGSPCPCGSGIPYGECCRHKEFRFEIDDRGTVRRRVKVSSKLKPDLDDALIRFRAMLGRNPGRGDPVIFDHYLNGQGNYWQLTQTIYRRAGVPDELFFAHRRTGLIVGEHSRELMPESDYKEWTDAIDEYFLLLDEGQDPFHVFTYLSGQEYESYKRLVKLIDSVIVALGFAYTNPKKFQSPASYFRYLLLIRSVKSLRTIHEMYSTRYDDDCLAIARPIYEAYLRMKLLRLDSGSSKRFEAMAAHAAGLFPSKSKRNGDPNYSVCLNPATGEEFNINISNKEIIKISDSPLDGPLYYELYPLLSGFVHPEFVQELLKSSIGTEPYQDDPIRAAVLVSTICVLLLSEVKESIRILSRSHEARLALRLESTPQDSI
ncbi:hypothetical protein QA639_31665 [Bradyrhizobium pachyrhizi]|uniref:SEC-C metal-binding domain-containing protein n=1 Tax=Bradyrhizobium pachyrhizi TaxID=280333 RepID=UPI0024B24EB0|nr:SEC-C metal-binding domain-containing protein [Bradyrhizobium pachyrhizi]WFU54173.1 hypothetical protein QA639_31665 [Bradyrhizobium pachyrhizi]